MPAEPVNPLLSEDSRDWERLIESLGPASLLVAIEGRMSAELRARLPHARSLDGRQPHS
jgi:hypothetical protein